MNELAIITGASGGLGKAFTKHLIAEVDEVWAIGRNKEKLTHLQEKFGDKIKVYSIDLSKASSVDILGDELQQRDYRDYTVKYLINNAGSGRMAPSSDFSAHEIESHIHTHNISMAILCNMCIPHMKKGSYIINVASQSAFQPVPYINLYASSKAFCCSYSRALYMELKPKGIVVTAVCPGWIKTDLLQTEMNGHKIKFPHLAEAEEVAAKALSDTKRGKDMSVYSAYVRRMQFFSKFYPHTWIMKIWLRSIKKYIE